MFLQWRAWVELLECKSQGNACFYRSRKVRVLAWMMPRSHRVGFLPVSACLCPNTSMATAPSVKYSIKSSLTDTASSCRIRDQSWANYIFSFNWLLMLLYNIRMYCVVIFHITLQLSNTTMQCGSLVLVDEDDMSTSGATMMGSCWSQNVYWQKTKLERYCGRPVACRILICRLNTSYLNTFS